MSREGRSQPIQPFATHGFLGNVPANGVLPPAPIIIERERRRDQAPVAISVNGLYAVQSTAVATPPNSLVVALIDERRRRTGLDPIALSAADMVNSGVGVPGTTPPLPQNIDRVDQRARYRPLDPITLNGLLASVVAAPAPSPPGPFVVPLDERKRFLAAIPATSSHGYDDADPPQPTVVESDRRRPRAPDPLLLSGVLAPFIPPITTPIPIYQLATAGGGPTLTTTGGDPTISTAGGSPAISTTGGDPTISTLGGTPTITTQGPA